jgi:hypothetical protein
MQIWYFDEKGNQVGSGHSYSEVPSSTSTPPITEQDIWDGEKWVTPTEPELTEQELAQQRIEYLQQKLRDTDYVALSDYDKDKPEILVDRQEWRDQIRELEALL